MIAIPVFRDRVAPVLDWCSRIVIVPEDGGNAASGRHIDVKQHTFGLMQALRDEGIETLICGALSPEMLRYGEGMGLKIVYGIAGEVEEVLQAYRDRKLDQPQYWLPGCKVRRRCKGGAGCAGKGRRAGMEGSGGPDRKER